MIENYRTASDSAPARMRVCYRAVALAIAPIVVGICSAIVMVLSMATQRTFVNCHDAVCDFYVLGTFRSERRQVRVREWAKTLVPETEPAVLQVETRLGGTVDVARGMRRSELQAAGRDLDDWIARRAPMPHHALIETPMNYLAYALIALSVGLGAWFVFRSRIVLWLEARDSKLRIERRTWWGGRVPVTTIPIEHVAEVTVATSTEYEIPHETIVLRLEDGREVALGEKGSTHPERQRAVESIRAFLSAQPGSAISQASPRV